MRIPAMGELGHDERASAFPLLSPKMKTKSFVPGWGASAGIVFALAASSVFAAGKQLWSAKLPGDAKWHSLTGLGTLVVGTADAIVAYDPDTGQPLWTRGE